MALFSLNELNFFFKFILVGQKLTCSQRLLILSYHITEELELYRLVNTCSILSEFKLDSDWKRMSQKCYQFFINEKLKKLSHFFTSILPNYVPHEITKEFWKNSHFENMTAGFLLSCQNTLRWEICLICHWNIDSWKQKLSFGYVKVPKNNQKLI